MVRALALLSIALSPALSAAQAGQAAQPRPLVFTHATVIEMTGAKPKPDMTLVIVGDRIAAVGRTGKVRVPRGAQVVNAAGRYLIPGLWDMHVHLGDGDFDKNFYLRLFVANGVTGIRIMEGAPEYQPWRREAEGGALLAPRMVIASPMLGFGDLSNISEARAREEVRKAKQAGADFIKVHDNLSRAAYFAVIEEAKLVGLPVEGHTPVSVTAEEVSQAGQKSIEHLTGLAPAEADAATAARWFALFKKNQTWQCPTLVMRHNYALLDDSRLAADPRLKYVKPSWRERWLRMTKEAESWPADEGARRRETIRKDDALVAEMQRAGVLILAGTDDANPYVIPGFGLHDELALLVKAGLTPAEALQAATLNPAKFLGLSDSLGTVERGKLADLLLLDANPLEDISNTKKIAAVVKGGRYLPREDLDKILAEVEAAANRSSSRGKDALEGVAGGAASVRRQRVRPPSVRRRSLNAGA
ncbi:MAG: amidohydrolase family protein [Acidobacteriota bacterium]|nr:amidohydrolase family protein [Acidobacteriota bacterium]